MKILQLKSLIKESIREVLNEFGPMYGSKNTPRGNTNPLVKTISALDKVLLSSTKTPFKTSMEWEKRSEELLGDNNYWSELDDSELEYAIDVARTFINKNKK